MPTGWAQLVVQDTSVVDDMFSSLISPIALDSLVDLVRDGGPIPGCWTDGGRLIRSTTLFIWNPCSIGRFTGRCCTTGRSQTPHSIVQLIVRLARHWVCIVPYLGEADRSGGFFFVATNPHLRIVDNLSGCAYRCKIYRESDFAPTLGQYGLPLHHQRFLEWVGAPESTRLLGRDPSDWIRSLSRVQSIPATCLVVFVIMLCFISVVWGEGLVASGGSSLQFLWFSLVVPLRGAGSVN